MHWEQEFADFKNKYRLMVKGSLSDNRSKESLVAELTEVRRLLADYELVKMDFKKGDKFYIASAEWFKAWKLYSGFDGMEGGQFPGPILNEDIIEKDDKQVICDETNQYLNINLKDNLREEDHYLIWSQEIWDFFSKRYGGRTIQRFGIENESGDVQIEVYLTKIYTYFFPMAQEN